MLCSTSISNSPSSPIRRTSLPALRSPSYSSPNDTPASCRIRATVCEACCTRSSNEAKSPTNHTYSTGSLRASGIVNSSALGPARPHPRRLARRSCPACRSSRASAEAADPAGPGRPGCGACRRSSAHARSRPGRPPRRPCRSCTPKAPHREISGSAPLRRAALPVLIRAARGGRGSVAAGPAGVPLAVAGQTAVQRPHSVQVNASSTCFQFRSASDETPTGPSRRPVQRRPSERPARA